MKAFFVAGVKYVNDTVFSAQLFAAQVADRVTPLKATVAACVVVPLYLLVTFVVDAGAAIFRGARWASSALAACWAVRRVS